MMIHSQTRPIGSWLAKFVLFFSVFFALYHYVTAGIGVPVDFCTWAHICLVS